MYASTFWSKILITFWMIWSNVIILLLFVAVFQPMPLLLKCILSYCCTAFSVAFLFLIFTASSVNYGVSKSYKALCSFAIGYSRHTNQSRPVKTKYLIKV